MIDRLASPSSAGTVDAGTCRSQLRILAVVFVTLILLLLVLGLRWRIPMMLWDHLDLVPVYAAHLDGSLRIADLFRIHGGHLHAGAYAVLLSTTDLSHGRTALDVVASWCFLVAYAGTVAMLAARLARARETSLATMLLVVFLAAYPGHLANLQWGWQVAVFACLAGAAGAVALLAAPVFTPMRGILALVCAACAFASFAIGYAMFPVGAALLAARRDLAPRARAAWVGAWLATAATAAWLLHRGGGPTHDAFPIILYALNFLGAGIARYATAVAPWLAALALGSGAAAAWSLRSRSDALAWIGLFLFGVASALLTAYGRAADYGADQAFATRYASFSGVFWIGWLGLVTLSVRTMPRLARTANVAVMAVAAFALFGAGHFIKKAAGVAAQAQATADTIRRTYPDVPASLLAEIYFDQPDIARARLERLHAWGFAPFDP